MEEKKLKWLVIEAFKPVHEALGEALGKLAEHNIKAIVRFSAELGILVVALEMPEARKGE